MGWKWGCQPFSCRCSQNVTHCRKEICSTCFFKESIPSIPCGNSKPPLPTRSLSFLRAAYAQSWLHHAHPFVAAAEKTLHMQRSRGSGRGVVVSKICYNTVIGRKETNATCLSEESMFLWKFKPPLGLIRKFRIFLNLAWSSLLVCKAWS